MEYKLKSIKNKLYHMNIDKILVKDGEELMVTSQFNDLYDLFHSFNAQNSFKVIPYFDSNLKNSGLFYNMQNKYIYNHSEYGQDIFSFNLTLIGLKKNSNYMIKFKAQGIPDAISNRSNKKIYVTANGEEILMNYNIDSDKISDYSVIYKSKATMLSLAINIGKVKLYDLTIDEVEIYDDVNTQISIETSNLISLKAYAVISGNVVVPTEFKGNNYNIDILRGIGLNVYYNIAGNYFIVERNTSNDIIDDNIISIKYMTNIFSKNKRHVKIEHIDAVSPVSKNPGYIKFSFDDDIKNNFIYILIYELL